MRPQTAATHPTGKANKTKRSLPRRPFRGGAYAAVAKLADAQDLGSCAERRIGSRPIGGTASRQGALGGQLTKVNRHAFNARRSRAVETALSQETARSMCRFQARKRTKPHRGFVKKALSRPFPTKLAARFLRGPQKYSPQNIPYFRRPLEGAVLLSDERRQQG